MKKLKLDKIIFFIVSLICFSLSVSAQVTKLEYYIDEAQTVIDAVYSSQPYFCQAFNSTIPTNVSLVSLWLKRAAGASGDSKIYIYDNNITTGYPRNVISELGFNDPGDKLLTSSFAWYNFTIPPASISSLLLYHLCIYNTQATNYIHIYKNSSNIYTKGYVSRNNANDTSWTIDTTSDMPFIVYYDGTIPTPPSMTLTTNLTNLYNSSLYPFSFGIWASAMENTTDNWNCSIYLNSTLNSTFYNVKLNQTANTQKVNLTYAPLQRGYNVNVTCSNYLTSSSILRTDIYLDNVKPLISTQFINHSFFYLDVASFIGFNFSDPSNLYAYNVTLRDPNNEIRSNAFVQNLPGNTYENHTDFVPDVVGNWTIEASAWDSHTDNNLKHTKIEPLEKGFLINDDLLINGTELILKNPQNKTVSYFTQLSDRYKFKATFQDTSIEHTFYLKSTKPLNYVSWSEYKGHFVYDLNSIDGGYWLDFQGNNVKTVSVIKLADNYYSVKVLLYTPSDEIETDSIGSLNYENQVYTFEVISVLQSTNEILTDIKQEMALFRQDLKEDVSMITLVILYVLFMVFGYWLITTGNRMLGIALMALTVGIDFFFIQKFYIVLIQDNLSTSWDGFFLYIFAISMLFWILVKISFPLLIKYKTKQ